MEVSMNSDLNTDSKNMEMQNSEGYKSFKSLTDEEKHKVEVPPTQKPHLYDIEEHPPIHITIFVGIQQALLSLSPGLAVSLMVADVTCANFDSEIKTKLLSSTLMMNGVTTLMMNLFGNRLPLFQGAAGHFLVPLLAMQVVDPERCDAIYKTYDKGSNITSGGNGTDYNAQELIYRNIARLQGSLLAAGLIETLIGATGLVGFLLRFVGPVTIVPTVFVSGVYFARSTAKFAQKQWGIAALVAGLAYTLSLFLSKRKTPIPMWSKERGFHIFWFPLHQVLSILLALLIGWIVCLILTVTNVFSNDPHQKDYFARTDIRSNIIAEYPWFHMPYPGQFGMMSFSISAFIGFFIATITSILDSIGDYHACAKVCKAPPPPSHSVNRGIAVEGLCSAFAGVLGCGHATSTYAGNAGAIGLTRVASRDVFLVAGIIYILLAIIGKLCAVFITIPNPVLGGIMIVIYGMFNGVVLSNLEVVNLSSNRNCAIIGSSILLGIMVPHWVEKHPDDIQLGSNMANAVVKMLLANPNLTCGIFACFLDNAVPGDLDDRGITAWQNLQATNSAAKMAELKVYEPLIPNRMKRWRIIRKCAMFPDYIDENKDEG